MHNIRFYDTFNENKSNLIFKHGKNDQIKVSLSVFMCPGVSWVNKTDPLITIKIQNLDPYQQTNIKALEQVQRRAARYVFNDYSTRTPGCVTKMLDDLEGEPLEVRRRHDRLSMLYRTQHTVHQTSNYHSPLVTVEVT